MKYVFLPFKLFVHLKLKLPDFLSDFFLMSLAFETTPHISLTCQLVPVRFQEYKMVYSSAGVKKIFRQNEENLKVELGIWCEH